MSVVTIKLYLGVKMNNYKEFLTIEEKEKIHKYTDKIMNDFINADLSQDTEQDFFSENKEIEELVNVLF